jgi:hypothetical protein
VLLDLVRSREDLTVLRVDMEERENQRDFPTVTGVPWIRVYRDGKLMWDRGGFVDEVTLRELIR